MAHGRRIPHGGAGTHHKWLQAGNLGNVPGLVHGFSLATLGDARGTAGRAELLRGTGFGALWTLRQVHGARVVPVPPPTPSPEADAWAGRPPAGRLLGILTADCLPVVLVHPASRTLGLAHAGWRGAVAGVAEGALAAMGVPAGEVLAALGPCIGPCCYEVGGDVAARVGGPGPYLQVWSGRPGKFRFDLAGFVAERLARSGVPAAAQERVAGCTACGGDRFFSYRGQRTAERMVAFAGWTDGGREEGDG